MPGSAAWTLYWLFVLISWTSAAFLLLTTGWSPCEEAGTCLTDGIGVSVILLLLPLQAVLAALLQSRYAQ